MIFERRRIDCEGRELGGLRSLKLRTHSFYIQTVPLALVCSGMVAGTLCRIKATHCFYSKLHRS